MKKVVVLVFVVACLFAGTLPASARPTHRQVAPILDDEFSGTNPDGTGLDLTNWQPNWGGGNDTDKTNSENGDDESCADPANATVSGGTLLLATVHSSCTTDEAPINTYNWSSATVESLGPNPSTPLVAFQPHTGSSVTVTARIWLKWNADGPVDFPAFWMTTGCSGAGCTPAGEIDILEGLNGCTDGSGHIELQATVHDGSSQSTYCDSVADYTGWHTYRAVWSWQPTSVAIYYDNMTTPIHTFTTNVNDKKEFVVFDDAVDMHNGGDDVASPNAMKVDWVTVTRP